MRSHDVILFPLQYILQPDVGVNLSVCVACILTRCLGQVTHKKKKKPVVLEAVDASVSVTLKGELLLKADPNEEINKKLTNDEN